MGEADSDFEGIGSGLSEYSIIKSAAATEPSAAGIEGETGANEGVDLGNGDGGGVGDGFEDPECAGEELAAEVKAELAGVDFREEPAYVGALARQGREIDFAG